MGTVLLILYLVTFIVCVPIIFLIWVTHRTPRGHSTRAQIPPFNPHLGWEHPYNAAYRAWWEKQRTVVNRDWETRPRTYHYPV